MSVVTGWGVAGAPMAGRFGAVTMFWKIILLITGVLTAAPSATIGCDAGFQLFYLEKSFRLHMYIFHDFLVFVKHVFRKMNAFLK
jgi:hypothetical protein